MGEWSGMNRPSLEFHIPVKTVLGTGCYDGVGGKDLDLSERVAPLYAIICDLRANAKVSAESTQKGGMGRFGIAATFNRREPCLDSFRVVVWLREDNRRVSSRPALGILGMHHTLFVHLFVFLREGKTPLRKDPIQQGGLVRHHSILPLVP
ncbi:hypothetical protein PIB30_049204 [Stylosanthes scabra]|uniref:Uncharacterized protein n=1 Tax=Stylosanthes scabra TaxID=79078 RepID=A0ABU6XEX4_9FABA|nr:hypothetical protein [Stylosanthes scabra]